MTTEMKKAGLEFEREKEQVVFYDGLEVETRRADFVIEGKLILKLKAKVQSEDVHLAHAKNYTVAYDFPKGLLINFGGRSLEYKLMFNPKYN